MSQVSNHQNVRVPYVTPYPRQGNDIDHEEKKSVGHRTSPNKNITIAFSDRARNILDDISQRADHPLKGLADLSMCAVNLETFIDPRILKCGHVFENSVLEEERRIASKRTIQESINKGREVIINPKCPQAGCGQAFVGEDIYPGHIILQYMNEIVIANDKIVAIQESDKKSRNNVAKKISESYTQGVSDGRLTAIKWGSIGMGTAGIVLVAIVKAIFKIK